MIHFKSLKDHEKDVQKIQHHFQSRSRKVALQKMDSPSNTLRNGFYKQATDTIDFSPLSQLITIHPTEQWALVEPRMTVRSLCETLLHYGFRPLVVPEFHSITIGGAINGAALESSSHRYGQFNDTCLEYEILLGDGTVRIVSPEKDPELFYGISGSYGTLALLTLAKIRILPSKPYVRLEYHRFSDPKNLFSFFSTSTDKEFLEGIVLNPTSLVGISGTLTDDTSLFPKFSQQKPWSPWYYQHIAQQMKLENTTEIMPIKDYLFRLDRGAFWMGRFLLKLHLILKVLFHFKLNQLEKEIQKLARSLTPDVHPSFLFRLFFGWTLSSEKLYRIWHKVPREISERIFFVQDFYTPFDKGAETLAHFSQKTGIFPIWVCPVQGTQTPQFLSPHYGASQFVNLGFYGVPYSPPSIPTLTAELEKEILRFGGRKMLYSLTYYSKDLFSKIYDYERYTSLRKKFHAEEAFLPLYNKIANLL